MPLRHPVAMQMIGVASDEVDEATNDARMREVIEPHTETTMREAQADLQQLLNDVEGTMQVPQRQFSQQELQEAMSNEVGPNPAEWHDTLAEVGAQNTYGANLVGAAQTASTPVMQNNTITLSAEGTLTAANTAMFVCGRGGLSPESDYCLDGWVSCNDLTCDVSSYVRMYGFNLDAFLADHERRTRHVADTITESLTRTGRELRERYLDWRARATPEQRSICGLSMLFGIGHQFSDYHWEVSDKAVIALMNDGSDNMEERLRDPAYMAQTVQTNPRLANWCNDITDGMEMLRADYEASRKGGILNEMNRLFNQPRLFTGTYTTDGTANPEQMVVYDTSMATTQTVNCYIGATIAGNVIQNVNYMRRPSPKRVPRRAVKLVRQAVKRSADLFVRHIGREQLGLFMKGQPFVIPGKHFDYEINKTSSVIQHTAKPVGGHIPYSLTVLDKDGTRLCKLCVYFDKTPVLDQIVALALFIRSGNEEEMLRRANAFDRHEKFKAHPKMIEFGKARPDPIDEVLAALNTVQVGNINATGTLNATINTPSDTMLREVVCADPDNFTLISEVRHVELFGVTSRQHREEVVPWRTRTRDPIIEAVSQMTNVPLDQFRRMVERDRSFEDTIMTWQRMPATFDGLLQRAFS